MSSVGREMPTVTKSQRAEVYKDHRAQLLLSKFISGDIIKLDPTYAPKYGYRYPSVEKILGDPSITDKFLNRLFEAGILKREFYDKLVFCPHCNSADVSVHYCCPYCKAFNIRKSSLIEHVQCGYIDVEERFRVKGKLVCPRCKKPLTKLDVDHRKAGVWCSCNECGKSFDIPVPSHFCRDCHESFTFEDALYKDVYSYTLSEDVVEEVTVDWAFIGPIREFLEGRGFAVKSPGFLKGKSSASHMFDVAASRGGAVPNVTVIDLATSTDEVSEQSVIAMFAKVYDVVPDTACLIAVPKMSVNGRKLAKLYKIELIEAKGQKEVIKALEACVKK